jgi:hypothetical protein
MTKTYLTLALLITVLAGNAYGEDEVYYCAETGNTGHLYDKELDSYKQSSGGFALEKFKIKVDVASMRIEMAREKTSLKGKETYSCKSPVSAKPEFMDCPGGNIMAIANHFNFNTKNGRFVYFVGLGYAWASGHDSIHISYGKCDKF